MISTNFVKKYQFYFLAKVCFSKILLKLPFRSSLVNSSLTTKFFLYFYRNYSKILEADFWPISVSLRKFRANQRTGGISAGQWEGGWVIAFWVDISIDHIDLRIERFYHLNLATQIFTTFFLNLNQRYEKFFTLSSKSAPEKLGINKLGLIIF